MSSKKFEIDDLIWAKMRGYPAWPGRVVEPPEGQHRKNQYYVFFFGTSDYSWIKYEMVFPYINYVEKYTKKIKTPTFKNAIKTIAMLYAESHLKKEKDSSQQNCMETQSIKADDANCSCIEAQTVNLDPAEAIPIKKEVIEDYDSNYVKKKPKRTKEEEEERQKIINKRLRVKWVTKKDKKKYKDKKDSKDKKRFKNKKDKKCERLVHKFPAITLDEKKIKKELVIKLKRCDKDPEMSQWFSTA